MKTLRAIIYLLLFVAGATVLVWLLYGYIISLLANEPAPAANPEAPQVTLTDLQTDNASDNQTQVTATGAEDLQNAYFAAIGSVQSTGLATLYPLTSGTVKKVNFREGDYVKSGEVIIELTGSNQSEHQSLTQLQIAETGLLNAQKALQNLQKSSEETIKTASLQLQSARNQTAALAYDLDVIEQNRNGLDDALQLAYDSLLRTESKNSRDEIKGMRDIDDLIFTLNEAQDGRSRTQRQLDELREELDQLKDQQYSADAASNATSDIAADVPASTADAIAAPTSGASAAAGLAGEIAAAEAQLGQLQAALDVQDKGIEELYAAIDKAKYGLNTMQDAAGLTVNQLLGQITQSENQANVLDLTLQSTRTKLGYGDAGGSGSSDALRLAEQAYQSTRVQLQTALDNAASGVKLAELNLELARSQASALQIRAPFDGVLTSLPYYPGQNVGPQQAVAEILDPRTFELEVGVDLETAERLAASRPALLALGSKKLEVPVKSVGLTVDDKTRLVKVRLALPNIFFKLNQTLKVELPLATGAAAVTPAGTTAVAPNRAAIRYLPLDAVIIGTESRFVFVNDNGVARKTDVQIGEVVGDRIEILSGLPADARIIVEGARKLVDGQSITITNP